MFGHIENDYEDYLGTGQPLKTEDDMKAVVARYLFRAVGDWFIGGQGNAANYQVLGATPEDDLVLETLGVRGFKSAALGAVLMHDSRDSEDMPTTGWFLNVNNLAYREALGGSSSFDAYRVDLRTFWKHGGGHVLAVRQYNWLTQRCPIRCAGDRDPSRLQVRSVPLAEHVLARSRGTRVVQPAVGRDAVCWRGRVYTARRPSHSNAAPIQPSGPACTS